MGFASRGTLEERLLEKILVGLPWECWPWYGGISYGGDRRKASGLPSAYGIMREGKEDGGSVNRVWRPHMLMLLLKGPKTIEDCPRDVDEPLLLWLHRARRHYTQFQGMQVSHQCDLSLCCNPRHLEWESSEDHRAWAKDRRERIKQDPGWLPYSCEPQPEDFAIPGLVPENWRDRIFELRARELARVESWWAEQQKGNLTPEQEVMVREEKGKPRVPWGTNTGRRSRKRREEE